MTFVSKSRYLEGLQCGKLLWYRYNAREEIPPYDDATLAVFEQGHEVGALARTLFPGGVEIAGDHRDFEDILRRSSEALGARKPLFEPAFRHGRAFARADILAPAGRTGWDIVEVKSSTEVKDVHLHDLALQKYAYAGAGLDIRRCILMYINREYERKGEIEPGKLLKSEDLTQKVEEILPGVEENLRVMESILRRKEHPDIPIGPWCGDPYDCPLIDHCWGYLPEHNVTQLSRIGEKGFDLLKRGIADVTRIPADFPLSASQKIQVDAIRSGRAGVDAAGIRKFLAELEYPLFFLDFESFTTAIPLFDRTRPYEQIPFQFSLHVVRREGARPAHHGYIAEGRNDPRPGVLERLVPLLESRGSVISYNASFEKQRIRESSERYPRYAPFWESVQGRFVDLLGPFRSFQYYHPAQKGSASMKAVLPALTGESYEGLEIAEGGMASREYLRVTFGDVPPEERARTRSQLETYCSLDTSGMIAIVEALRRISL